MAKILKDKNKNIPLSKDNSKICVAKKEKTNHLADTFAKNFDVNEELHDAATELNVDNLSGGYGTTSKSVNFSAVFIKAKEISGIINRINPKLSADLDNIPDIGLKKLPKKQSLLNCVKVCIDPTNLKASKAISSF